MIRLIDLSFNANPHLDAPFKALSLQKEGFGYIEHIKGKLDISVVEHINYEGEEIINGVRYNFFKRPNNFWLVPFKTLAHIKKAKPDVILSQGMIFPIQLIALRLKMGKDCIIIVQHHGERPFKGIKLFFQKLA